MSKPTGRPSWDTYLLEMAAVVARRSTCLRAPAGGIGCVLVDEGRHIVGTGYVGSLHGQPHCTDPGIGCLIDPVTGGCVRTVHSEQNAILRSVGLLRPGVGLRGATAYSTLSPCWTCWRLLVQAGVTRIVYRDEYRLGVYLQREWSAKCGIEFVQYRSPNR